MSADTLVGTAIPENTPTTATLCLSLEDIHDNTANPQTHQTKNK